MIEQRTEPTLNKSTLPKRTNNPEGRKKAFNKIATFKRDQDRREIIRWIGLSSVFLNAACLASSAAVFIAPSLPEHVQDQAKIVIGKVINFALGS